MTTRPAPRTFTLTLASLSALLLAGAWCTPALASTDIEPPCPELVAHTEASLHVNLDDEAVAPALRTLDTDDDAGDESADAEDATIRNTEMPDLATRLPGVSPRELHRVRRYMFRTDI